MTAPTMRPRLFVALMDLGEPALDRRTAAAGRRVAGRRLAQALLARASGTAGWTIESETSGRPQARHPRPSRRFEISIAHSGTVVAAAVYGRGDVGIDIERRRPDRDHRSIARLAFGPRERRMVERGGIDSFYRLWTLREAMSKATGEGLAMVMDAIDRLPADPHTGFWMSSDRQWLLAHLEPYPDTNLALAVRTEEPVEAVHWSHRSLRWLSRLEAGACLRSPDPSPGQGEDGKA